MVKEHIEALKKQHYQARHWCYAYQLGKSYDRYRANDDGEPSNSAGAPIYGQLQSFDVTNVLVVVVRYFGGVKLGVSGLINAYRTGAQLTLEASKIVKRTIDVTFEIRFEYPLMNVAQRIIKDRNLNIVEQNLRIDCHYVLSVRKKEAQTVIEQFKTVYGIEITGEDEEE